MLVEALLSTALVCMAGASGLLDKELLLMALVRMAGASGLLVD